MKIDGKGRIHFKIVYYGPTLSGKTTALRWLYTNVKGLKKGKLHELKSPDGRTMFFDYLPISTTENVIFDVFTVAGARRHRVVRQALLRDKDGTIAVDGIVFVVDSSRRRLRDNIECLKEIKEILGDKLGKEIPIVFMLNKQDVWDAMSKRELIRILNIEDFPVVETVAIRGKEVAKAFMVCAREIILKKLYKF